MFLVMNTHLSIKGMKMLTNVFKKIDEWFFGPEVKPNGDPNKVISITDYNTEILKQKNNVYSDK